EPPSRPCVRRTAHPKKCSLAELVDRARNLAFQGKRQHAHDRVTEQPWHEIEAHHEEEPRDVERDDEIYKKARSNGLKEAKQRVSHPDEELHASELRVDRQKDVHARAPDQGPHDRAQHIVDDDRPDRYSVHAPHNSPGPTIASGPSTERGGT